MRARLVAGVAAIVVSGVAAGIPAAAQDEQGSAPLWKPGPAILYEAPATAPQLTNTGPFEAKPLLVSGAHAYVDGEFLYQDFLYDDGGANGRIPDPNDKRVNSDLFSARTGTYDYPTGPEYLGNAADLVELRVKPLDDSTAIRITLTELQNPDVVAATIGLGTPSSKPTQFPFGADVKGLADTFVTVHGNPDRSMSATDGTNPIPVSFDTTRAQITLRIPPRLYPKGNVWRLTAGVGLWNSNANPAAYLLPSQQASATQPGGAGILNPPAAFFNVAFREHEPLASLSRLSSPQPSATTCMWRDCLQAAALAGNDISSLYDDIDIAKLESGGDDFSGVPVTGSLDRIFSSHKVYGSGGVTYAKAASQVDPTSYKGEYQGQLQPYNVYVPSSFDPHHAYPFTLQPHALSANYNQYMNSDNQSAFGERAGGSIVATSNARGPDGWYYDSAEADVFEMWNDVAHHYRLDPTGTVVTGYSMGGYATYKLSTQFPDLFAKDFVTVGPPADGIWTGPPNVVPATGGDQTNTYFMLESLRNVPILIWHGTNDELVPADGPQLVARRLDALGYRYEMDTFPGYDHFAFGFVDTYDAPTPNSPAAFLTGATVDSNPPHISYVVNPTMDFPGIGIVADHAYWLSGLTLRDKSGSTPRGNVDVRSEGFCAGDATANATQFGAGVAATPYTREYRTWGDAPAAPCKNVLDINATNVSHIVVDARRARVDCNPTVNLTADGPVDLHFVDCPSGQVQAESVGSPVVATGLPNTSAPRAAGGGFAALVALAGAAFGLRRVRRRGSPLR